MKLRLPIDYERQTISLLLPNFGSERMISGF
jgi:hypothetical protein